METVGSVAGGVGNAVVEKTEEITDNIKKDVEHFMDEKVENFKASNSYILTSIIGIFVFVLLFIIWRKRKIIYHFLIKADEVKTNQNKNYYEKDEDEF